MRRYLGTIGIVLFISTGIAVAGPHGGGGVRDHRRGGGGGTIVRDHRGSSGSRTVVRDHRGSSVNRTVVRDHRGHGAGPVVRDHRGPVRVSRGRYVFPGGVVRTYRAPVIRQHYYSYYHRPALIVESYDPVPGYVWMRGDWRWNGVEWLWVPGYWVVAGPPAGISVGASVVIH